MSDEFEEYTDFDDEYEEDYMYDDDYDYYDDDDDEIEYVNEDIYIDRSNDDSYEYEEEYDDEIENKKKLRKSIHINTKVIKVLLIMLIVLILTLIVLLVIKNNINVNSKSKKKNYNQVSVVKNKKVNTDLAFETIKKEVLNYYNKDNFKDKNKLTLKELKDLGLIKSIDKVYDLNRSMIEIYQKNNDYRFKISLYYNKQKKNKIYVIGKYIYCHDTYLCEKSKLLENKQYEYVKNSDKTLSNWSDWNEAKEVSCNVETKKCEHNDFNCLEEVKITTDENSLSSKDVIYETSRLAFKTIGKEIINGCRDYDYIKINGIYYRADKNSNFKVLGYIKKDTAATYYRWKYNGRESYYNPPNDTTNTRYVYIGADYSNCGETCDTHPKYVYDSYTFMSILTKVTDPINDCNMSELKLVPNYSIESQNIMVSRKENTKIRKCYSSTRKRQVIDGQKDIKWSEYEDKKLLDNGYSYTGNNK